MDRELYTLSLTEAWEGIVSRRFSSEEYLGALASRVAELDSQIEAWAWLDMTAAVKAARASDHYLGTGGEPGPLQGIPVGVKDNFSTKGVPTEMGSPAFAGHIPDRSAEVVKRLEAQRAFVMGKTVTTECAFLFPGKTKNPWNPIYTPGGSSSGSAAAVACGFVPAAIGTQTNGSVIRPAAFCGVVGYKPSQGLIPLEGALTFSHSLDQAGLLTRRVADAAWLAAALSVDLNIPAPKIHPLHRPPILAAVKTPVWDQAEDYAQGLFMRTINQAKEAGGEVEEVELPEIFNQAHQILRIIMLAESAFNLEDLRLRHAPLLSPILKDFLAEGRDVPAVVYLQALALRKRLQDELSDFLSPYDAVITPPATGEAPATLTQTGNPAFCTIWSLCGVPAITVPVEFGPRGMPLGLQIVGNYAKDDECLAIARWLETLFNFPPLGSRK